MVDEGTQISKTVYHPTSTPEKVFGFELLFYTFRFALFTLPITQEVKEV